MLKEQEYGINEEIIKEYFPLDKITPKIFEIFQKLLSLQFEEIKNEVKLFYYYFIYY